MTELLFLMLKQQNTKRENNFLLLTEKIKIVQLL